MKNLWRFWTKWRRRNLKSAISGIKLTKLQRKFFTWKETLKCLNYFNRPVGWAFTRSSLKRKVYGSNLSFSGRLNQTQNHQQLTSHHHCDISSNEVALQANDAEMGPENSLHDSTQNKEVGIKNLIYFYFDSKLIMILAIHRITSNYS